MKWANVLLKVAFFQKVRFVFQISVNLQNKKNPNYYPELKIWICCLLIMAGNLNFMFRIVIWNIYFWRFEKWIALSEKKPPLALSLSRSRSWQKCEPFALAIEKNKDQTVCYNFVYRAPLHSRATTANTHFAAKKQLRMHKKAFSAAAARRIWQQRRRAPGMIIIIEELRIFSHSWHLIGKLWLLTLYDTGVIHKWR